jgi:hypothetical protein
MTPNDNPLNYGYILARLPSGDWWHLHFGRAAAPYDCLLLGRQTNIFACIQQFGPGVVARTPQFILTLDGSSVDRPVCELALNFDWDQLSTDAAHFQESVMPLLYTSANMQRAIRNVIERRMIPPIDAP